jgi:signal transduction histidine kinase/CheY-like chemotaxis protein
MLSGIGKGTLVPDHLACLLDAGGKGLVEYDDRGRPQWLNAAACRLLDPRESEATARRAAERLLERLREGDGAQAFASEAFWHGEMSWNGTVLLPGGGVVSRLRCTAMGGARHDGGRGCWLLIEPAPEGQAVAGLWMEAECEAGDSLFQEALDALPSQLAVIDHTGTIAGVNRAWTAFASGHGVEAATGPGANYLAACDADTTPEPHSGAAAARGVRAVLAGERDAFSLEYPCAMPDGEFWFEMRVTPLVRGAERWAVVAHDDITEERRAAARQERLDAQAQNAQQLESLGMLAGGIAHDFNNLLAGIMGNASLAATCNPGEAELQECLGEIEEAASRAADLCQQMLAFSGRGRLNPRSIDLAGLVRKTAQTTSASLPGPADLHYDIAASLPPVRGDHAHLEQMVGHLLANAAEAMPEGGRVWIRMTEVDLDAETLAGRSGMVWSARPGRYVRLEVRDEGHGMTEEVLSRAFEPFYSTRFTGRGLGLAAVLGIVRSHGGLVTLESQVDAGACVRVDLPAATAAGEAPQESARDAAQRPEGAVLVVDDEEVVRRAATGILTNSGYSCVEAPDGEEALAALAGDAGFAAVLLDLSMPRMDGLEVYQRLRGVHARLPVVFSSGYSETGVAHTLERDPCTAFIQKPYRADTLVLTLRRLVAQAREQ